MAWGYSYHAFNLDYGALKISVNYKKINPSHMSHLSESIYHKANVKWTGLSLMKKMDF